MSDIFADTSAAEAFLAKDAASPAENTEVQSSEQAPSLSAEAPKAQEPAVTQAIAELDKMEKFKLDGQEWTLKDLKAAIMRQKDYTQKTQTLAQERKTLDEDRRFRENLAYDLRAMEKNPALANEFLKIYPEQYHKLAEEYLRGNTQAPAAQPSVQQSPQVDFQLLSRVDRIEKIHQAQEVAKNEQVIEQTMNDLSAKYPNAADFKELVLARAYEAFNKGTELSKEVWEDIFKGVDSEVDQKLKGKYGNLVKKQTEANAKAQDVGAGGGTAGRAPQKFSKFDDLAKYAEEFQRS